MRKIFLLLTIFFSTVSLAQTPEQIDEEEIKEFIMPILTKMSLEDKVGQMTQITLDVFIKDRNRISDPIEFDYDKLKEAIIDYKVGSILNTGNYANSIEQWHKIITEIQDIALNETELKIPILYGIDAIHGANYTEGATLFPQAIAMAATRNTDLVYEGGRITAYETRASGIPWNFNPVLGIGREPLWSRMWETFGEDVYLTTKMGEAYINGQQGNNISSADKVATCIKHYLGYSIPKNGKDRTPAWIPERMMREIFLPPFQKGVELGAQTLMVNSSEINGIPSHSNKWILTDLLKDELNFKGFVVSDWEDIKRLHTRDRVAATPKEAVKMAVEAGLDMSMVPYDYSFFDLLLELVKNNEISFDRIDDAVYRILRVKYLTGLYKNPFPNKELVEGFASDEFTKSNLQAAQEAITLLKNDNNILPLSKETKVLVTGPTANLMMVLNGGWTINWQGDDESQYPEEKLTILEAIQNKIGIDNVSYSSGADFEKLLDDKNLIEKAQNSDVIIACLGEAPYCESEGIITDLAIDDSQIELVNKLNTTGKKIIYILVQGRPRVINEIEEYADGIVNAYLPGMEGGQAIADVIFGDVNPSGKLPFTYPKYVNGYTTYDHKPMENFDALKFDPQWTFGHGLSYTSFEYSDLNVDKSKLPDQIVNVSVKVKNSGDLKGKEVVELYICDVYGSVTRPVRQLKRFTKIELEPGETKEVSFTLKKNDLTFIGRENNRIFEPGEFKLFISDLEKSIIIN